jgi:SAM-dependent methyltransferase
MDYGKSDRYQGSSGEDYFAYQNRLAADGAKLNARKFHSFIPKEASVLDFGCGGGWLLRELECGKKTGVELNEAAHDVCARNGIKVHKSLDDVPAGAFDIIVSHHCLEHVPYPIQALRDMHAKLKDGGRLVLVLPVDDWRVQRDFTASDIDHHLQTWTPRLIANTLAEAGFRVERVDILTHAWFPGAVKLAKIVPPALLDLLCFCMSVVKRRRQLRAVACKA